MEAPSAELERSLQQLRLVSPRDFDRCRNVMARRLKGLPAFDSIWIETLIQIGKLTSFQGRLLEQQRGPELQVGPNYVVDHQQCSDRFLSLLSARHIETRQRVLISRMPIPSHELDPALHRVRELASQGHGPGSTKGSFPIDVLERKDGIDVVFPFSQGLTLDQLLVRRGRFPEAVVRCLATTLATQLLNAGRLAHGDLRPGNIRLLENGQVRLLNWGVVGTIHNEISIHSQLPLEYFDAVSPERFQSGLPISGASDIYGLGCTLWQLLAGRPPFPMADKLARIVAHQQRTIPDIREVVPDVSETLAALIRKMTFREPHRRLQNLRSVVEELSLSPHEAQRRLRSFNNAFESAAPRRRGSTVKSSTSKMATAAVVGMCTLAAVGLMWNRTLLGLPGLSTVSASANGNVDTMLTPAQREESQATPAHLPLPAVDANGVIQLVDSKPYRVDRREFPGKLTITGTPEQPATIIIAEDGPLQLSGETIAIEHVIIIDERATRDTPSMHVTTQELALRHCRLETSEVESKQPWLLWNGHDHSDPHGGRMLCTDSVISGSAPFLQTDMPLTTLGFINVLKQGAGGVLVLDAGVRAGLQVPCVLQQCTFNECGPLITLQANKLHQSGRLSLQSQNSVFAPQAGISMFELVNVRPQARWEQHLEIDALSLIVPRQMPLVIATTPDQPAQELDTMNMKVDGLLGGEFAFGPDGALHVESLPVQTSSRTLGVDRARLLGD